MDRGLAVAHDALDQVGLYAQDLQAVDATLRPSDAVTAEERQAQFLSLQEAWQSSTDPIHPHGATMMSSFEPGVFVGGEAADFPTDHVDLERWFKGSRGPKVPSAASMAIATLACGLYGKGQHCCWRLMRMGTTRSH